MPPHRARNRAAVSLAVLAALGLPTTAAGAAGETATPTAEQRLVTDPDVLWLSTFDSPDWQSHWGLQQYHKPEKTRIHAPAPADHGNLFDVRLGAPTREEGQYGTAIRGGFAPMGIGARQEAYLRYRVYIPADFDWSGGGKLPGLSGITEGDSPFSTSAGGEYSERSWSGRLYFKAGAGLVSYLYVKHADGKYISDAKYGRYVGISPRWYRGADPAKGYAKFRPGAWNTIEIHYRMNTPGRNDGVHRGWLNGELGVDLRDVQYRTSTSPGLAINQMFFSVFYGGPEWARTENHLMFDDVVVSRSYIGPRTDAPAGSPPPADAVGPRIELSSPVAGQVVSGRVEVRPQVSDPSGVDRVRFHLDGALTDTDTDPVAWTLDADALAPGEHVLRIDATDKLGNVSSLSVPVRAADTIPPTLTERTPAAGATAATPGGVVTARFSEPMDPATVTAATFTLTASAGGPAVPATVAVSADGRSATLTPSSELAPGTAYTAALAAGVADAAGNPLSGTRSWSFATAGAAVSFASGVAVVEAEDHDGRVARSGHEWAEASRSGAVGSVMRAGPDTGLRVLSDAAPESSPELRYRVRFDAPGTYRLWARTYAVSNGNSFHAGLNGRLNAEHVAAKVGRWTWTPAAIAVPSAGVHTVTVWMREDGLSLDRLLLTAKTSYVPSGTGPVATQRG